MFNIFADAHKIIATEIYESVLELYGLKLDKKSLLWGSVLPDISPKYKLIRHYKEESLEYIINEIINLIETNKKINLYKNKIGLKILSKKIGIISHYLSDYTCLPHAERWTFQTNMIKHIKYEADLNKFIKNYKFKENRIKNQDLDLYDTEDDIYLKIEDYINNVVDVEYKLNRSLSNDLDFAISLNLKINYFILESIELYQEEFATDFILNTI